MKYKISFEFDTEGLPLFDGDIANIKDVFSRMEQDALTCKANEISKRFQMLMPCEAYLRVIDEELELIKRIMKGMSVENSDPKKSGEAP